MAEFIQKTDTLNEGREKLNAAITDAEKAKVDAEKAVDTSGQAKQIAQAAENKADSVQAQFNQVVIEGDSSVEAAQARVTAEGTAYGTLKERLDAENASVTSQLAHIVVVMPPPSTIEENTLNLQALLDISWNKGSVNIQINEGVYELGTCYIGRNTTIKMSDKTILKKNDNGRLFVNAKPSENDFLGYAGHGNIHISGGKIEFGHLISMIHGENITLKNIDLSKCKRDHYIEIAGCKNVVIDNCTFSGMAKQKETREFVEYIQLDSTDPVSFPFFPESSVTYDDTPNESITISNCSFLGHIDETYNNVYCGVGGHVTPKEKHRNITIKGNNFIGATYSGVSLIGVGDINIIGNKFTDCNRGVRTAKSHLYDIDNISLIDNQFYNNNYPILIEGDNEGVEKVSIKTNIFKTSTSHAITLKKNIAVTIEDNYMEHTVSFSSLNTCVDVLVSNNKGSDLIVQGGLFRGGDNIVVINNMIRDTIYNQGTNIFYFDSVKNIRVEDNSFIDSLNTFGKYYFVRTRGVDVSGFVSGNYITANDANYLGELLTESPLTNFKGYNIKRDLIFMGRITETGGVADLREDITKYNAIIILSGSMSDGNMVGDYIFSDSVNSFNINEKYPFRTNSGTSKMEILSNKKLNLTPVSDTVRKIWGIKFN